MQISVSVGRGGAFNAPPYLAKVPDVQQEAAPDHV